MSSVNKVILVGRLGADPELRHTPGGQAVCTMSLATNRSFDDRAGQRQDRTCWHRVVAWGKQGELCKQYLSKGRLVYVEGRLESGSFTDKEGLQRHFSEVVASSVVFLGRRQTDGQDGLVDEAAAVSAMPGVPDLRSQHRANEDSLPF